MKESNEMMMKTMDKQFARFALTNNKMESLPRQPETNLKAVPSSSSSSLEPNGERKVNAIIVVRAGRTINVHVDNDIMWTIPFHTPLSSHEFASSNVLTSTSSYPSSTDMEEQRRINHSY